MNACIRTALKNLYEDNLVVVFRFREELQQISKVIKRRNEERDEIYTYPFLDPEVVPSSITI